MASVKCVKGITLYRFDQRRYVGSAVCLCFNIHHFYGPEEWRMCVCLPLRELSVPGVRLCISTLVFKCVRMHVFMCVRRTWIASHRGVSVCCGSHKIKLWETVVGAYMSLYYPVESKCNSLSKLMANDLGANLHKMCNISLSRKKYINKSHMRMFCVLVKYVWSGSKKTGRSNRTMTELGYVPSHSYHL